MGVKRGTVGWRVRRGFLNGEEFGRECPSTGVYAFMKAVNLLECQQDKKKKIQGITLV